MITRLSRRDHRIEIATDSLVKCENTVALPGGGRTLWIASKGFRLHPILLSRTSPVARVVYSKRPFAGPEQVLAYLGRYTHRVALANSRLTRLADGQVDFTWKDYRHHGKTKVMTLAFDEFIRRFLLHTVPDRRSEAH